MMKTTQIFKVLVILIFIYSPGTEGQTTTGKQSADTLKKSLDTFLENELNKHSFYNPVESNYNTFSNNIISLDTTSIWLQTRMQLVDMAADDPMKRNFKSSIINPLRQQYAGMESMKALKYILTTIQAGAVGYMAYEHIRKYGFLKKK